MNRTVSIKNLNNPTASAIQAKYCASFMCRLKGLMFHPGLGQNDGLMLVQSHDSRLDSSIHMLFVWFDLGVIWIDSGLNVVDAQLAKAWRLAYFPKAPARYVLEVRPEKLDDFHAGDKVEWENA